MKTNIGFGAALIFALLFGALAAWVLSTGGVGWGLGLLALAVAWAVIAYRARRKPPRA